MKEVIDKISSYNIFNFILPGILFAVILSKITTYSLVQSDLIVGAFLYYFIGLIISRFGSLIVEPLLKKVRIVKFTSYNEFISACKKDPKIELLSEINNMYRTLIAMLILLLLAKFYEYLELVFPILKNWNIYALMFLLILMFLFSYKKQTEYIAKRVKSNN